MRVEIERFVASLTIPADRKAVVLAELLDHVSCAEDAAAREGRDVTEAGRAALGDLEALRRSLEAIEPAFRVTRLHAIARGIVASALVAFVIDQAASMMMGILATCAALAIVAVSAPPRVLELLRADMRAKPIRGSLRSGRPIGPALAYAFTVMSAPFLIWIGLIVQRAYAGVLAVDTPWCAFSVMVAVYVLLLVEAVRARREAIA